MPLPFRLGTFFTLMVMIVGAMFRGFLSLAMVMVPQFVLFMAA